MNFTTSIIYLMFTSSVLISAFPVLGYKYFESSSRMIRLPIDCTIFRMACRISMWKIMVWIESNVTGWLPIPLFLKLLKNSLYPLCGSRSYLNWAGVDKPGTQSYLILVTWNNPHIPSKPISTRTPNVYTLIQLLLCTK